MNISESIDRNRIPKHIAIIMDGNGRWAKERGEDRVYGHYEGVVSVREIVDECGKLGVQFLTLYAFSAENWNRPQAEVEALMELLVNTIRKEADDLKKNNVKLHVIGQFSSLPAICQQEMNEAMEMTSQNNGLNLVLALSYSSRDELVRATKIIAEQVKTGKLDISSITDETITQNLYTAHYPEPELMIRTSGECRISNFLLYQLAYAELFFTPVHWPDFRKEHLHEAILNYQKRERRFGKTSEQIQTTKPEHAEGS